MLKTETVRTRELPQTLSLTKAQRRIVARIFPKLMNAFAAQYTVRLNAELDQVYGSALRPVSVPQDDPQVKIQALRDELVLQGLSSKIAFEVYKAAEHEAYIQQQAKHTELVGYRVG